MPEKIVLIIIYRLRNLKSLSGKKNPTVKLFKKK